MKVHSMPAATRKAVHDSILAGTRHYRRERDLPRLLPLSGIHGSSGSDHRDIVKALLQKLRVERQRGRAGHWSYDLNRHIALWQAFMAEHRSLHQRRQTYTPEQRKGRPQCGRPDDLPSE